MDYFKLWMKKQYQWDDQFDQELQYSQQDMEAAFKAGLQLAKQIIKEEHHAGSQQTDISSNDRTDSGTSV